MNLPLSITGSPLVSGNTFVVALYAQSAPNVLLQSIATVGPYVDSNNAQIPFQVMFTNVSPQLYKVILWESSNGTASGRIENSFVVTVSAGNAVTNIRTDLFLIGGVTTDFPVGSTSYSDPSLVGWLYRTGKEGYGILQPSIDYIKDTVNGGFSGLSPIQQGEVIYIQFQPQNATATLRDDVFLTVNTSPNINSGTSDYADGTLAGLIYDVFENGFGILQPNKDMTINPNGGWSLIGRQFQDGQTFVEMFQPNFQQQAAQPSPYSGTLVVTADTPLTNADCGKSILIMGIGTHLQITLPLLATVNDFQTFNFNSCGGNHINVNIVTLGTDGIQRKIPVGEVILAQDEQLRIYKALDNWQVDYISPTVDMVGQVIYSYDKNELNTVLANGAIYQRADLNRLFKWMFYLPDISVSDSIWPNVTNGNAINRGYYTMGTNGNDFRVPDLTTYGIVRNVDGNSRLAASLQPQNIGQHDHVTHGKGGIPSDGNTFRFLSRLLGNKRYAAGGGNDSLGGDTNPDTVMRTGDNSTDPENRMSNTGIYCLIRI